ncbi:MAG: RNA polymerase sigma factor [Steroidobacteraceae bacterium]
MTEESASIDRPLAIAAAAGDRRAFEQLVARHKAALYRLARRYVGDPEAAYDIVQETWIAAWMSLRRFDPERPFSVWVRAIALNKCRDQGRRGAVRRRMLRLFFLEVTAPPAVSGDPRGSEDEGERTDADHLRRLEQAIADLPRLYKEPLLLTLVSGLTQQQAAAELKTTTKAIEMRIRRAKRRLAEALVKSASVPPREG